MIIKAQSVPEVTLTAIQSHHAVPAGQPFTVQVEYSIPDKHHLTSNFFELHVEEIVGFQTGLQQFSQGEFHKGEIIRRGKAVIQVPVMIDQETAPGDYILKGSGSYQICREEPPETCFPPVDKTFEIRITVLAEDAVALTSEAGKSIAKSADGNPESPEANDSTGTERSTEDRLQDALKNNLTLAFVLIFLAGILTSLTPCVYPMIPITISYIGGKSTGEGKMKGFILSLFYVLGLALIYASLGVVAALTGSLFGSITQTPWVIGGVAVIFGIMGLSMLGMFDIQLPSAFQGKLQSGGPKSGYFGAVVMGMIAGLVAAPCAGPPIVALMTFIASTGNIVLGFTLMMAFAFGMGLLFIALGTFSGLLTTLPAAGMWMDKVKKVFGIIMIGAALFIAKPLLAPPVFGFLMGFSLLMLGSGFGAFRPITPEDSRSKDLSKGLAILLVALGVFFMINLIPIPGRIIPERASPGVTADEPEKESLWLNDLKQGLEKARVAGKPVLLDFGAEWCVQCKELEHRTFSDDRVLERLKNLIPVRIDCTKARDQEVKSTLASYGVSGLPTVILLDSNGDELGRFTGFLPPEGFLGFLEQTLASDTLKVE